YRRWRQRRRFAKLLRLGERRLSKDIEDYLEFARRWAPFGGPPEDEVFLNFGMSRARFNDRLGQILADSGCESDLARQVRETCPPATTTTPDSES
ncbi:MAG: hypothetical protein ACRDTD_28675, partial [Pseudonocardiaceae bacterium]